MEKLFFVLCVSLCTSRHKRKKGREPKSRKKSRPQISVQLHHDRHGLVHDRNGPSCVRDAAQRAQLRATTCSSQFPFPLWRRRRWCGGGLALLIDALAHATATAATRLQPGAVARWQRRVYQGAAAHVLVPQDHPVPAACDC
jgi:hypothetical protein